MRKLCPYCRLRLTVLALIGTALSLLPIRLSAQSSSAAGRLVGSVGAAAEAYTASGITNRRDATSGVVFGRAASRGPDLRYGFQFRLASEQSGSRQALSRASVNIGYRFLGLTAGDLSPILSRFSINGATVRGGSAEVAYEPYMISFLYGRVRRSADRNGSPVFGRPSLARWLYAARVGAGPSSGTHVHLIGAVARDDAVSSADSSRVSPVENVTFTPDLGLSLLEDRIQLRATYTLAAFSADTRTEPTTSGVSSMLGFFTPRAGSRIDYAADVSARFRVRDFRLKASYERVQPGFRSLGLTQIRSDQAVVRIEPSVLLADRRANLHLRLRTSRNNLSGNRTATLKRRLLSFYGHFRPSRVISVVAAYSNFNTRNDVDASLMSPATSDQRNVAQTFMIGPTITAPGDRMTHVLSVNASYQFLRDRTPSSGLAAPEIKFDNVSATAAYSLAFASGLSANVTGGILSSKTPSTDAGALSVSTGGAATFFGRRARVSLNGGWSRNTLVFVTTTDDKLSARQLSIRLVGSYRIPDGTTVRLSARGLHNSGDLTGDFDELQVGLRVERRF